MLAHPCHDDLEMSLIPEYFRGCIIGSCFIAVFEKLRHPILATGDGVMLYDVSVRIIVQIASGPRISHTVIVSNR